MTDVGGPGRRRTSLWVGLGLLGVGVALAVVAVVLAVGHRSAPAASASPTLTPWSTAGADPAAYAARLVTLTNDARASAGLGALATSGCAAEQAATRAAALAGDRPLEHAPMEPVMKACGVADAGENLSSAQATPDDVVKAWMGSPGHRANILGDSYDAVGVACQVDGARMLCSQVFLGP